MGIEGKVKMKRKRTRPNVVFLAVALLALAAGLGVQPSLANPPKLKMTTPIPVSLTTPDEVNTRLGTLKFVDGSPSPETVAKLYDNLDFLRGVEAFLNGCPGASLAAMRAGMQKTGAVNGTIGITETRMDSKALFLTANTESIYAGSWLDLKDGPIVVESPPNTLGIVNDFWFRYVADLGNAGPDKGKGGKFLFVGPGYKGEIPKGYFVYQSPTNGNFLIWRGFMVDGDPKPGVANIKKYAHIYPLAQANNPPRQKFVNMSGKVFNTVHANDFTFFQELNQIVQEEPAAAQSPELLGLFASIGIIKGKPFNPGDRMKKILTEAAAVGNATARALVLAARDKAAYLYPNSQWKTAFIGGRYDFTSKGVRNLDARTMFHYYATMVTPAMSIAKVGVGSQYAFANRDSRGNYLDGSKTYKLHFPPKVPAKDFWSVVIYDNQTRSLLQTDQKYPSLISFGGAKPNADGSYDIYFGPKPYKGKMDNWIQTIPGKGWNTILRFYGPLQPWFDKTWRPGEIELVK